MNIFLKHYLSRDTSSLVLWCFQCHIPGYPLQEYKSWSNQSCHAISSMRLDWLLCFWIFSSCILATWTSWGHGLIGARLFNERSDCKMQSRRPSEIERRLQCYLDDVSVKNESGTVRPQENKSKNNCFSVWNVFACRHLHAQEPPPYILLFIICALQRGCFCYITSICSQWSFPRMLPNFHCRSEIWNPLHKTSAKTGETCLVDLKHPRNNFTKGSWRSRFWIHVEPSLTKKKCVFYRNVQIWATRKLPICITKQSLTNQLRPLSNAYPCSNATWATKLFSRGQGDASFKSERNRFQSPKMARKKYLALSSCPKLVEFSCKML